MPQHDNKTYEAKVRLRLNVRAAVEATGLLSVVETHGGFGRLYQRCYQDLPTGVVFDNDSAKALALATQRPNWSVYEANVETALIAGVGFHRRPNLFDLDPYGSPWEVLVAICGRASEWYDGPVGFAVNDGLRKNLILNCGWKIDALAPAVAEFGNHNLYRRYLDACRWMVAKIAAQIGRRVTEWAGYCCGFQKHMTHYGFVLT